MLGDPAREPLAETAAEELHVDLFVGADGPGERDRDHLVGRLDEIHPGVVVIDDAAGPLDHRPADLLDGAGPAQARGRGLEDAELRGFRLGLLEEFRVGQRDTGVRRERRDERDIAARPPARLVGDRGQRADHPVVVHERRHDHAGELDDARISFEAHRLDLADIGERQDAAGPQDLTDPPLVATEDRQPDGHLVRESRPRRGAQPIAMQDADHRAIRAEGATCLVDDGPEELLSVVGRGQPLGDPEDGVEPFGELHLERAIARRRPGESLADRASEQAPEQGRPGAVTWRGGRDGPGQAGHALAETMTHAHPPMVASTADPDGGPSVPSPLVRTYGDQWRWLGTASGVASARSGPRPRGAPYSTG